MNNSPYGVMIWTYYTGSSITVELWSTPYVTTEQTGQTVRESSVKDCWMSNALPHSVQR